MIGTLQALRALAALGIVWYHSGLTVNGMHVTFAGVQVFFVISGFICCYVAARRPKLFFIRRLVRITPLYWLSMFFMLWSLGMLHYWPRLHVLLSMVFVPHDSPAGPYPVLGVGWTLNNEVACYALLGLSLRYFPSFPFTIAASTIVLLNAAAASMDTPFWYMAFGSPNPVMFVAGMILWGAFTSIRTLPAWTAVLFPVGLAAHLWVCLDPSSASVLGIPHPENASSIVLVATALIAYRSGYDVRNKGVLLLGAASYSLYLIHTPVQEILRRHDLDTHGLDRELALYVTLSIIASIGIYRFIEPLLSEKSFLWLWSSMRRVIRERRKSGLIRSEN